MADLENDKGDRKQPELKRETVQAGSTLGRVYLQMTPDSSEPFFPEVSGSNTERIISARVTNHLAFGLCGHETEGKDNSYLIAVERVVRHDFPKHPVVALQYWREGREETLICCVPLTPHYGLVCMALLAAQDATGAPLLDPASRFVGDGDSFVTIKGAISKAEVYCIADALANHIRIM